MVVKKENYACTGVEWMKDGGDHAQSEPLLIESESMISLASRQFPLSSRFLPSFLNQSRKWRSDIIERLSTCTSAPPRRRSPIRIQEK